MSRLLAEQIELLEKFSPCDVSDALLKLQTPSSGKVPKGGFLADLVPYAPSSPFAPLLSQPKVVARVSTLKLIDKSDGREPLSPNDAHAIPKGSHWADETVPETVLVIDQPAHQTCAAVGGIMASRMKVRGLRGCVVSGRVRDLAELKKAELPIWASSSSTVGAGAESKVFAQNIPITINGVVISPNDIIVADPLEGLVVIPQELVDTVIDLMPTIVAADDKVKEDVELGSTVQAAFKKYRS